MKTISFLLAAMLTLAASLGARAQTATLTSDTAVLRGDGGTVTFTATAEYTGKPAVLCWAILLPETWSLVSVGGPDKPGVAPDAGTTGELEFAYVTTPASRAQFTVTVRYPATATTTIATPTVFLREAGKQVTLPAQPVRLEKPQTDQRAER